MGNSSCTLVVRLEGRRAYASGDTITGRVYLSVNDPNGVPCSTLNIHFCGKESAVIHYRTSDGENGDNDYFETNESIIFNLDVPLYNPINGRFELGQYEFPFQFTVPMNLPTSMSCHAGKSHCHVCYEIKAHVIKQPSSRSFTLNPFQKFNNAISSKIAPVAIHGTNDAMTMPIQELHFPPESYNIKNCCKDMGRMELTAKIDSHLLKVDPFNPKNYNVTFDVRNHSKVDINRVEMELVECISWRSRTKQKSHRDTLAHTSIDTEGLDSWKSVTNRLASSLENTLLMHGTQATQSEGESTANFTFTIPNMARDTFSGNLIEVTHFVRVKARTSKCCTTNPELSVDVQVCRPPSFHGRNENGGEVITGSIIGDFDAYSSTQIVTPSAPMMDNNHSQPNIVVDAIALPHDWVPQTADLVTLPVAVECNSGGDGVASIVDDDVIQPLPSAPPITQKYQ